MRAHQLETTLESLAALGDARHLGGPPGPGRRRRARPRRVPPGTVRGRAGPPATRQVSTRRVRQARFEQACAIEDFDFTYNPKIPAARIRDLADAPLLGGRRVGHPPRPRRRGQDHDRPGARAPGLPPGPRRVVRQDVAGCWPTSPAAMPTARGRRGSAGGPGPPRSDPRRLRHARASRPHRPMTSTSLSPSAPGKSLIITANRSASDWYSLFPNPVVAESILDRVVNSAHHIHMEGKSYRPKGRPDAGAKK